MSEIQNLVLVPDKSKLSENRTRKSSDFRQVRFSDIRISDIYCIFLTAFWIFFLPSLSTLVNILQCRIKSNQVVVINISVVNRFKGTLKGSPVIVTNVNTVNVRNPNVRISAFWQIVRLPNSSAFRRYLKSELNRSDFRRSVPMPKTGQTELF